MERSHIWTDNDKGLINEVKAAALQSIYTSSVSNMTSTTNKYLV